MIQRLIGGAVGVLVTMAILWWNHVDTTVAATALTSTSRADAHVSVCRRAAHGARWATGWLRRAGARSDRPRSFRPRIEGTPLQRWEAGVYSVALVADPHRICCCTCS